MLTVIILCVVMPSVVEPVTTVNDWDNQHFSKHKISVQALTQAAKLAIS